MGDIYKNIEIYNPNKKQKYLSILMNSNKKRNLIVTELFIRLIKLNFSLAVVILVCQKIFN